MSATVQDRPLEPLRSSEAAARPYPPSYLDRLMERIRRLPIAYWLTYLILFAFFSALNHSLAWIDGWLKPFNFAPLALIFPMWQWMTLAVMTHLNQTSKDVLTTFRPLLAMDEGQFERLKYEFTTMPPRGAVIASLFWLVSYLAMTYVIYNDIYVGFGMGRLYSSVAFTEGWICFTTGGLIYYHSIRQLLLVNRVLKMARRFNVYQLEPVYAFSRLTARTGISWMLLTGLTVWMYPIKVAPGLTLTVLAFQVLLAMAAFVLPLRLVNQHLVQEKRRLMGVNHQKVELTLQRLHQAVDANQMGESDQIAKTLEGLRMERDILSAVPTWPWRVGTLTAFLSASALSIVPLLVQIVIERLIK